jgi:hypothetical protein
MAEMNPKEFIQTILINDIGKIHLEHPYVSFALMAIGIEFLGKCLNTHNDWVKGKPKNDFELAINSLNSFTRYRPLLTSHRLWDSFRNGFAHSFTAKKTLTLSSKDEAPHLQIMGSNIINLRCEDFYADFKNACEEVIAMETFASNKMGRKLLTVPNLTITNISYSGTGETTITASDFAG